jgi:hypothetical protein
MKKPFVAHDVSLELVADATPYIQREFMLRALDVEGREMEIHLDGIQVADLIADARDKGGLPVLFPATAAEWEELIARHGLAALLKAVLTLVRKELGEALQESVDPQEKNPDCPRGHHPREPAAEKPSMARENFVEHRGALFRRLPNGEFDRTCVCPACMTALDGFQGVRPFACPGCNLDFDFTCYDVDEMLAELAIREKSGPQSSGGKPDGV